MRTTKCWRKGDRVWFCAGLGVVLMIACAGHSLAARGLKHVAGRNAAAPQSVGRGLMETELASRWAEIAGH